MQTSEKRALTIIGKDEKFLNVFRRLTVDEVLQPNDQAYILAVAILLVRRYERDKRLTSFAELAYYIVLKYSLQYEDYVPLFDFSINFGFYPIAKELLRNDLYGGLFSGAVGDYQLERFQDERGDTLTLEQHLASSAFLVEDANESCYLAPTSFGKSSLIVDQIKRLESLCPRAVVVVPTKSLLIQTLHMIRKANLGRKLMIHDEMYDGEDAFIAVFTQERALRLLAKHNTCFDLVFIDEAHNLLKNNSRSILLSRVIAKNRTQNPKQRVFYLSPLLQEANHLRLDVDQNISSHNVKFNVKEPEIYELRLNQELHQYNRFINRFFRLKDGIDLQEYLLASSGEKNFVYNYRPVKVEKLAGELCGMLSEINLSDELREVIQILKNEVHPDFYAIEHLKYGVVYLHGKLPDLVKEYLESKFRTLSDLKYVVANSVILEGMNLPIDTLFIFNTRSLNGKELMNLIGRVNRLNTIFGQAENRLSRLLPKVHFINSEDHYRVGSKMENKIKLLRSRVFDDKIMNPTLEAFDLDALVNSSAPNEDIIDKIRDVQSNERFLTSVPVSKREEIRAYFIQYGIVDFYSDCDEVIDRFLAESPALASSSSSFWSAASMMEKIEYLFLRDIDGVTDFEVGRLQHSKARASYEMHILVTQKRSLNENINSLVRFFEERARSKDSKMYFGTSYGEEPYETQSYPNRSHGAYVDLAKKDGKQLVNLAVVKLKMEDDFVSFKLNKFIVMLYDYELISRDEYNRYIYGTTNEKKIRLTKFGLSVGLVARLEADKQLENLELDEFNNLQTTPEFEKYLLAEDDFYRFEIRRYIG